MKLLRCTKKNALRIDALDLFSRKLYTAKVEGIRKQKQQVQTTSEKKIGIVFEGKDPIELLAWTVVGKQENQPTTANFNLFTCWSCFGVLSAVLFF